MGELADLNSYISCGFLLVFLMVCIYDDKLQDNREASQSE